MWSFICISIISQPFPFILPQFKRTGYFVNSSITVYNIDEVMDMMVNTNNLVPMTEANQNFSKVTRLVDEAGLAVILKNNKPRYIVLDFDEYDEVQAARLARKQRMEAAADRLISENPEAFQELAK